MRVMAAVAAGVVLGAGVLAGGSVMGSWQDAKPAAGCAVAFVNISKVFQAYPRAKKLVDDLQGEAEQLKSALTAREQDLRKEAQDLEMRLTPGTPEFEQAKKKIELRIAELQYDRKSGLDAIMRKQVLGMGAVYREVCAEAERIAGERGFACVFNIDTDPIQVEDKGQVMGVNELKLQMALRTAVWARPEYDISRDVIEALNKAK